MLVLLDLSLCLAFPPVRESVRVRRNSKNEKTIVLSIQKNLFLRLLRLFEHHLSSVGHAGAAERRASTGWGLQACSHQTNQTGEACARPGEEHSFARPFHYSRATPPQGGDNIRKEWVWLVSAKITPLSIAQKRHSCRFQGPLWTVDTLLVINTVQNVPHFYL